MPKNHNFIYHDVSIRPKNGREITFIPAMLADFMAKNAETDTQTPEERRRVCEVFAFMMKLAMKYLPPKQRKIFYSVWARSEGKMKEGIMSHSKLVGDCFTSNYCSYYKAVKNLKRMLARTGFDELIIDYLKEGRLIHEED